ncbi:hypothetical protein EH165_00970 [Nakamurella antarctica]|uniref:Uncharacterized protein n=1 Tax=Nakamurella antarctica TaxID=1902245 RepID=A0A3G8ZI33_9ACTN|nr:hypothetical protein [Nakamurella antarctica]AZI56953.1 hypothetical protein EH165_00970 [Nakamurella antarctica]
MPPPCGGCTHPRRAELDADIVMGGGTYAAIGAKYGLLKDAVRRHRSHISKALARVINEEAGPRRAIDRLEDIYKEIKYTLEDARAKGNGALSVSAAKELRSMIELLAKLTGELDESTKVVINLATLPDWIQARGAIFEALSLFPDAALAVANRLQAIEA